MSLTNTLGGTAIASTGAINHRVTFVDHDGTVLKTQYLANNATATPPVSPSQEGYDFIGWDKSLENITESLEIIAQYTIKTSIVTFKDGDLILSTQEVPYGSSAVVNNPEKIGHSFDGWSRSLDNIKTDTIIYASFTPIQFTVLFLGRDGLALKNELINYGGNALAPTIIDPHFVGWDVSFVNVQSDLLVKPLFNDTYKLTFTIDGETVLEILDAKSSFTIPNIPMKTGYDVITPVWSITDFSVITEDTEVAAFYYINTYTVVFQGLNGKILSTEVVNWKNAAPVPVNTEEEGYEFKGWNKDFSQVTTNLVVVGEYSKLTNSSCTNFNLTQVSFALLALAWILMKRKK
jgi:hypothetical protein